MLIKHSSDAPLSSEITPKLFITNAEIYSKA